MTVYVMLGLIVPPSYEQRKRSPYPQSSPPLSATLIGSNISRQNLTPTLSIFLGAQFGAA
jgi:hypothetical protein